MARHRIVHKWAAIVDTVVARHAKAEKVTGTVLHVIVDSSVWMSELVAAKRVLIQKINASLPKGAPGITDIRFTQRSWAKERPDKPREQEAPDPDETHVRQVRAILEPIEDERVRAALARILEKDRQLRFRRMAKP
jgi:predicted nucleic acid-binding Zn ribbon protein